MTHPVALRLLLPTFDIEHVTLLAAAGKAVVGSLIRKFQSAAPNDFDAALTCVLHLAAIQAASTFASAA